MAKSQKNLRLGILAALLLMAGCGQHPDSGIRFGLSTAVVTLDPRFATDATSTRLCRLLYRSLVDFDDSFEPVADLAHWRVETATRYVFELRGDEVFHDGSKLTAEDVVATYRSILDPEVASPHRASLANLAAISARDRRTIVFELERPDPLFPGLLVIGILPSELVDGHAALDTEVIGSGPFRLDQGWTDKRIDLVRVSDGVRLSFLTVRDPTVRALKLAHGELDIVQGGLAPEVVSWLDRQPQVSTFTSPGTTFTYLGFNLQDPVLGENRVRRALALAIDREAIIKHLFAAKARPASTIFAPEHWASSGGLDSIDYDPDTARAILTDLGYDDRHPLRLTYKTSSDLFRLRIATVIQDQLAKVGVEVEIQSYDWGTFYGDIKAGRFQMYALSWVGLKLPDIFRYVFHSESAPPHGANRGRYRSAFVDELIENAEAAFEQDDRVRFYRQIQSKILADLPYVPLWYEDHVVVLRDDVVGYTVGLDGNYDALSRVEREEL